MILILGNFLGIHRKKDWFCFQNKSKWWQLFTVCKAKSVRHVSEDESGVFKTIKALCRIAEVLNAWMFLWHLKATATWTHHSSRNSHASFVPLLTNADSKVRELKEWHDLLKGHCDTQSYTTSVISKSQHQYFRDF